MATDTAKRKKTDLSKQKCITHKFRLSFPALFEPKAFGNQEPKFSCVMLFDKDVDLWKPAEGEQYSLRGILKTAAVAQWGPDKKKWPEFKYKLFRDGDLKGDLAGYAGTVYCAASAKADNPPGIVDRRRQAIMNRADLYAGCFCRAQVLAYAYDNKYSAGLGLSLQNIQKLEEGERFSGKQSAASVFSDAGDDDDEESFDDDDDSDGEDNEAGF